MATTPCDYIQLCSVWSLCTARHFHANKRTFRWRVNGSIAVLWMIFAMVAHKWPIYLSAQFSLGAVDKPNILTPLIDQGTAFAYRMRLLDSPSNSNSNFIKMFAHFLNKPIQSARSTGKIGLSLYLHFTGALSGCFFETECIHLHIELINQMERIGKTNWTWTVNSEQTTIIQSFCPFITVTTALKGWRIFHYSEKAQNKHFSSELV